LASRFYGNYFVRVCSPDFTTRFYGHDFSLQFLKHGFMWMIFPTIISLDPNSVGFFEIKVFLGIVH